MSEKNEMGNLKAIMTFFGIKVSEMRTEIARLSEDEKNELGKLSREALKAEEMSKVVAEVTG